MVLFYLVKLEFLSVCFVIVVERSERMRVEVIIFEKSKIYMLNLVFERGVRGVVSLYVLLFIPSLGIEPKTTRLKV